jgi:hypothetical protein
MSQPEDPQAYRELYEKSEPEEESSKSDSDHYESASRGEWDSKYDNQGGM